MPVRAIHDHQSGRVGDKSPAQLIDLIIDIELRSSDQSEQDAPAAAGEGNGGKKLSMKEKAKLKRKQLAEGVPNRTGVLSPLPPSLIPVHSPLAPPIGHARKCSIYPCAYSKSWS